ncbi:hypothetical protein DH2020_039059 [Rehmannia glutinosa]|uniref:NB-ARC domain-containing protein n=1 Tax=Rehmannia glutinosa TaxID=99300 RepID=A0ABR0UXI9_REHGL
MDIGDGGALEDRLSYNLRWRDLQHLVLLPGGWKEIGLIWGVEDELRKLQRTFFKIQDLLDYMNGGLLRFSGAWQIWFEDLRKLSYDADALLDHVSLHLSTYCSEHSSVNANPENHVFSMVVSSFNELNLPHQISEMQKKLEELARELESLATIEKAKGKIASTRSSSFSNLYSFSDDVVGRARDKERLVDLISKECHPMGKFSVISIVGMGGIGKTTVAKLVYDDDRVCSDFQRRIWVSMSMEFDLVRVMKSMIEYSTLCACNLSDLNSLQVVLQGLLCGRKFLLVLDDYWSENEDEWDILHSLFRFGSKGSRIIVTTRSAKVSSIVRSSAVHRLEILSDDDCWELIKQRAFTSMDASTNFEEVGVQIARKCKGLPLVAMALGSVLHRKCTQEEWRSALENELWDLPPDRNVFLTLMLSYMHLPAHLQKCFAYCSIFPQNYEFEVDELVLLWMAEGFIQPVGSQRLEDLGSDYFNDLYLRSFFKQCKSTSNKTKYKMHDLIHDMARLVSKDICFHAKYTITNCYPLFGNACHLSLLHLGVQPLKLKASQKNERLRTFLAMSNSVAPNGGEVDPQLFLNLQFLRVLDLSRLGLTELPSSIDKLKYLRYLNLSENPILSLPESMCKLVALQTLKLRNCSRLRELPKNMSNLTNLRHLDLDIRGLQLQFMPLQFGRLTGLQTLSAFIIGRKKGHGIEELKNMNCLRGSLCIKNIEYVSNVRDAMEANLGMKTRLDRLELQWRQLRDGLDSPRRRTEQAQVFANLQPHENLKELIIENYCGVIYPDWLSESWRGFTSIHLQGLKYCDDLPALGQLPFLKSFVISDMPCLVYVGRTFYGTSNSTVKFPSLESFELRGMSMLIHWINVSDSVMPCLNNFTIHDCPNLISLPSELQALLPISNISNCPSLQLLP